MKLSIYLVKSILLIGLVFSDNPIIAQSKFELSAGLGWPELLDIGVRYGNNFQVGVSQSFWSFKFIGPTSAEVCYHFGGKSELTERPPWYLFGGLGCLWGRDGDETDVYFYPRIGRSLNFSERTGINCDIGAFFPLSKGARDFFDSPIYPSGSISFFIRL